MAGRVSPILGRFLVGLIAGCHITFVVEMLRPLDLPVIVRAIFITVLVPAAAVSTLAIWPAAACERAPLRWPAAAFALWAGGYFLSGLIATPISKHALGFDLDSRIPFVPAFVWLYLVIYPFFLVPLVLAPRDTARRTLFAYLAVLALSYTVFVVYPVSFARPAMEVTDFSTWTLSLVYSNDPTWNCFPSTHCAVALMAALVLVRLGPLAGAWGMIVALSVGVSTLFTKQHYVVDVLAGWALAFAAHHAFFRWNVADRIERLVVNVRAR